MKSAVLPLIDRLLRLLDEHPGIRFLVALTAILALKWHALFEPPVWDTAMGLFPAALTLSDNNFNLLELLSMPGYLQGGPNTHSTSLVTLLTAGVLKATGGGGLKSFVVLHVLHFAAAAYALVALFDFVKPVLGRRVTAVYCLSVLLFPVFSSQVGYVYLEIPLFLCAVASLRAWVDQRFWAAVLWASAAFAVKETGIIVSGALVAASLLEDQAVGQKAKRMALILAPPVMLRATTELLAFWAVPETGQAVMGRSFGFVFLQLFHYLDRFVLKVPDLWFFFIAFIAAVPMLGPEVLKTLRREPRSPDRRESDARANLVLGYSGILIVMFILFFMIALPVLYRFPFLLPRYSVIVAPFLLLWFGYALHRLVGARWPSVMPAVFAVLAAVFAVNTNGVLYPSDIDSRRPGYDHALTERSNAYRQLLALEVQAIAAVKTLPAGVPVYYGHYEHYLLNYPGLGFSDGPPPLGHNLQLVSLDDVIREVSVTPCIYALYGDPFLGGEKVLELLSYAEANEHVSSEIVQEFRNGRYVMTLFRIRRDGARCPG